MNKKFWATTFTLSGTLIGAGILGMPYVFAKSGFLVGVFWIIFIGTIMTYLNLCLSEVTLISKTKHQLPGYAKKYLGKKWDKIMFLSMVVGIYAALVAYLVGEGESFSKIIPGNINPIIFGILFWLIMTLLLQRGLRSLKKIETYGVITVTIIIIGIFVLFLPNINSSNLITINPSNFFLPVGIVMFAFLGFSSIPELRTEIKGQEKYFKKAIIIGSLIPLILYLIFSAAFVGVLGKTVTDVATISFGPYIALLGIFTMLTAFFVLSFVLKDTYRCDFKLSKRKTFFLTSILPLLMYLGITTFKLASFSKILSLGGTISGGLTGILILMITKKAKDENRKTKLPLNWPIIILLSIIFIATIVLEFI